MRNAHLSDSTSTDRMLVEFFKDVVKGTLKGAFDDLSCVLYRVRFTPGMQRAQHFAEQSGKKIPPRRGPLGKLDALLSTVRAQVAESKP
jgi:hypothetical protein